ncbi:MAG: 6-phosphogluconolactonase [Actinobacteria bacterium]|nr:6-phosphogluconolactonase [Actinomycetota bacterium]
MHAPFVRLSVHLVLDALGGGARPQVLAATGATPAALYADLTAAANRAQIPAGLRVFALDEYWRAPPEHPASFAAYLRARVGRPLQLAVDALGTPDTAAHATPDACARDYAERLREARGAATGDRGSRAQRARGVRRAGAGAPGTHPLGRASDVDRGREPSRSPRAGAARGPRAGVVDQRCPVTALLAHPSCDLVVDPAAWPWEVGEGGELIPGGP